MSEYEGILESLEKLHGKVDRITAKLAGVSTLSFTGESFHEEKKPTEATIESVEAEFKEFVENKKEEEFDKNPIIWITHEGKKYKACKYKCGNYVSWDDTAKKYLHYDAGFKLIGHDCPKYTTGGF